MPATIDAKKWQYRLFMNNNTKKKNLMKIIMKHDSDIIVEI